MVTEHRLENWSFSVAKSLSQSSSGCGREAISSALHMVTSSEGSMFIVNNAAAILSRSGVMESALSNQ